MLVPSWGQRDMPKHNFSKTNGGGRRRMADRWQ